MKMKRISADQYLKTRWKNNSGETSQIAISPASASFPEDQFDFRISTALIEADSDFSLFENYQRSLLIWKGEGLLLNGHALLPYEVFSFSGSDPIHASLIRGSVQDLGVIYQPEKVRVEMKCERLHAKLGISLSTSGDLFYLFCAQGNVKAGNSLLTEGEVLEIKNPADEIEIDADSESILVTIAVSR